MTENSKSPRIVVLNTRAANVHSVEKALRKVGADPLVTSDPADLAMADAAVLPGVGASDAVMTALNKLELTEPVKEFAASGKPLLCVCVGLQVLFDGSEEGELPGLGLVAGNVELIPPFIFFCFIHSSCTKTDLYLGDIALLDQSLNLSTKSIQICTR